MSVPNQCLSLGGAKSSGECSFGVCRPAERNLGIAFATAGDDSSAGATYSDTRGSGIARGHNLNAPALGVRPDPKSSNVVEVISDSTRRTDEGEKLDGYCALPSLEIYLLVESERALVIAYRRGAAGFVREVFSGLDAIVPLD